MNTTPYSYRANPAVPDFDDSRPLFVFDGMCVMCSGAARMVMRLDRAGRIAVTPAQGAVGQALYRHYGLEMDDSYLFLADGKAYVMSDGYFAIARQLGGLWRLALMGRIIPRALRDAAYRIIARNRYRWFGRAEYCALLTEDQRKRLL